MEMLSQVVTCTMSTSPPVGTSDERGILNAVSNDIEAFRDWP